MAEKTGRFAIIEQFIADGITHMFGNPGTVEQGFLDALAEYPEMKYILTLQESVALLLGDGFARATKKPALVQIHSTPGLGNTIGALYQAMRGHVPLVVIGGDAGIKYMPMEAQMYGDLVAFAQPVTKWSTMVKDAASLLRTLRRGIKIAATPPMGPVYICLPADILDSPCVEAVVPTSIPSTRVLPDDTFISEAAFLLIHAKKPMIFMGDGIAYSGAKAELEKVAELIGAEVWGVDSGELNMSYGHPLYQGQTGHMFGEESFPITSRGDVNLVCGTYMVPEVFPRLDNIFAPNAKVIHIDLNAHEIAKNHPVDLGVVSDPKLTLARLAQAIESAMTPAQKDAALARFDEIGAAREEKLQSQKQADRAIGMPLNAARFMEALAAQLPDPKEVCVFDEALTHSAELNCYLVPSIPGQFLQTRGGSLGVGIPGAIALKLAYPEKTVLGFTGDGGSMYTIQALWTAAHHKIGAKFVICNNQSYMLLKLNILQYWKDQVKIQPHAFPAPFDLTEPVIDFAALARSMGVPGVRVEKPDEVGPAIKQALDHTGPFLIDLVVTGTVPGSTGHCKCGQ
ncbi:MAG: thiamine pyrophosphate-binding protein [Proteobacteria bacterium]|nr:thiamine pyrophosphate-binding protein [Pseudomonadota bacterium]